MLTEKTTNLMENQKYVFLINPRLNKTHIKSFFKKFYNLSILQINTLNLSQKKRQILTNKNYTKRSKRCILTISKETTIPSVFLKK
uniref:Large ribosomal subunit protein uL23c n=1 Tax=Codium arabicum TaxID=221038 RepID=A0A386B0L8_CODAR|nr:ribosomal protein L23 [Codium arabicum]AYC65242.1 ribosomal protein L23 [Codium arabicum]